MAGHMVVIDYGHGGIYRAKYQTAGKQYDHQSVFPSIWVGEGILNRVMAARVIKRLLGAGVRVFDCVKNQWWETAPSWMELEQTDVALSSRAAATNRIQRQHPDAPLISLHSNAIGMSLAGNGHPVRGTSFWTSKGTTRSDALADSLWRAFDRRDGCGMPLRRGDMTDGDHDHEADFHMLTRTVGVAVLIECGYFTNIDDVKLLLSLDGQRRISKAIYAGVTDWLETDHGGDA